MSEFDQEDTQRYLRVPASQPGAADRIRRWRAHCRRRNGPAVTVMALDNCFHLEVRWPDWWPCFPKMEVVSALPGGRFSSASSGSRELCLENLDLSQEHRLLARLLEVLDCYGSEELRRTRRESLAALPPPEPGRLISFGGVIHSRTRRTGRRAVIPQRLPDWEYQVLRAGLDHLFGALPGPLTLCDCASYDSSYQDETRLTARLGVLAGPFLSNVGPYLWEPERFLPLAVQLGESSLVASRPGRVEDQAVFWLSGETLTGTFQGFLRLLERDGQWFPEERSFDQDWGDTLLDVNSDRSDGHPWDRPDPLWKQVALAYPQAEPQAFSTEQQEISSLLYENLAWEKPEADQALDLAILDTLHGPPCSCRQLLGQARQHGRVYWDFEASSVTRRLAELGQLVLAMENAPASTWKLLAHLDSIFPCYLASSDLFEPQSPASSPRKEAILQLLQGILRRAGCQGIVLALHDEPGTLAFQPPGQRLAHRNPSGCVLDQIGQLWISLSDYGEDPRVFDSLGQICAWTDPEERWLGPLWKAAILETARLENP